MLVYLDTAQLAWLEAASEQIRSEFLARWRKFGCELAISLQILQEVQNRGSLAHITARLETLQQLQPLRGIPAGSAGVMVFEITEQMRQRVGGGLNEDRLSRGRRHLFPPLALATLRDTVAQYLTQFRRFNLIGQAQAALQQNALAITPVRKGTRVDPSAVAEIIRGHQEQVINGLAPNEATNLLRECGDLVVQALYDAGGDLWEAKLRWLGISELTCLKNLRPEDYLKVAGFVQAARDFATDIADGAGIDRPTVLALVNELRPYDAPGFSVEMAVARARTRHARTPTPADQVDEEHVSFAPYVDLMFVDKRTRSYIEEEVRRHDSRIAFDPSAKLVRPRSISDVLDSISVMGSSRHDSDGPGKG